MSFQGITKAYARAIIDQWRNRYSPFYEERFKNLLSSNDESSIPIDLLSNLGDSEFFWVMTKSQQLGYNLNGIIPSFPSAYHQRNWTGAVGDATFLQAFQFYKLVLKLVSQYGNTHISQSSILDFGCGWGRILRFFLREVPHPNLHGCDVWDEILNVARSDNKWCTFSQVGSFPQSSYSDEKFDVVYLYSVFSHLSEECHTAWVNEFRRILKPGGILVVTTRSLDYLKRMDRNRKRDASSGLRNSMLATDSFPDIKKTIDDHMAGKFCFSGTGGGGPLDAVFYGEASIPRQYITKNWKGFTLCEEVSPSSRIDQTVFCVRKD